MYIYICLNIYIYVYIINIKMMGQSILKYANVLNQVSSKATVFHKIIIYFGISHTFVSGYIYIMLKQKVGQVRH